MLSAGCSKFLSNLKLSSKVTLLAMLPVTLIGTLEVWILAEHEEVVELCLGALRLSLVPRHPWCNNILLSSLDFFLNTPSRKSWRLTLAWSLIVYLRKLFHFPFSLDCHWCPDGKCQTSPGKKVVICFPITHLTSHLSPSLVFQTHFTYRVL